MTMCANTVHVLVGRQTDGRRSGGVLALVPQHVFDLRRDKNGLRLKDRFKDIGRKIGAF